MLLQLIGGFREGFEEAGLMKGLSIGQMAGVKLGVTAAFKFAPVEYCRPGLQMLTAFGYGAALWNIGVIAGSGPAAIPVIVGLTWWQWDNWDTSALRTCLDPWQVVPLSIWNETTIGDQ